MSDPIRIEVTCGHVTDRAAAPIQSKSTMWVSCFGSETGAFIGAYISRRSFFVCGESCRVEAMFHTTCVPPIKNPEHPAREFTMRATIDELEVDDANVNRPLTPEEIAAYRPIVEAQVPWTRGRLLVAPPRPSQWDSEDEAARQR